MAQKVAVIGAGFGGLAAAIELAVAGVEVHLYERHSAPGGKAAEVRTGGFRFDTGPSLLTMPFVVDDLYTSAGRKRDVLFEPVDPICRYFFDDGTRFDAWSDEMRLLEEVRNLAPGEEVAVRRFLDYSERIYRLTSDLFLFNRLDDLKNLLHTRNLLTLLQLPRIDAFRSVHNAVSSFFEDHRLVQIFDRYATYNGSDPFKAPATLNIIPHVEYRLGGYYVRGGMHALVTSLARLAQDMGVTLHYESDVQQILHDGQRVRGLRIHGEDLPFSRIVSNADAVYTLTHLLEASTLWSRKRTFEPSCSGFVFLWGVDTTHAQLAHHNIFFSGNYRKEFRQIFDECRVPSDPTVYVSITSKADPDHAPPGQENWFVLINMPALTERNAVPDIDRIRESVLRQLTASGVEIRDRIMVEHIITPADLETKYSAFRGSIYGISSNSRNAAFLRPGNRVRQPRGLYLCGGAAHPGGGVPLVLLSGKHAAKCVIEDLRM
ncbi:MAG: phytoene desaturase family protein [Bacteroidia bacterium]|nr:phytoene desaturase family protein [Bacteroidia bacterium]